MHSELLARLGAATGPDRELDGLIAQAVGAKHGPDGGWSNSDNGDYWTVGECAKPYTASIDAALTLVPDGWDWVVRGVGHAICRHPLHFTLDREGFAPTPALAIVIAAIRAKGDA